MLKNKEIRKQASQLTLASGTLVKLSLGVCICIVSVMIPLLVAGVFAEILTFEEEWITYLVAEALFAIEILMIAALTIPVIGGFVGIAYKLYKNEDTHLAEIFLPFTSSRLYLRVIVAGVSIVLRWIAVAAVPLIVPSLAVGFVLSDVWMINLAISGGAFLISLVCTVFFAIFTSDMFFVPYFICNGCGIAEAFGRSRSEMRGRKMKVAGYTLGFSGIFILSLLTVGTLFVIYTIPMMTLAYFVYAEKNLNETQLFEIEIEKEGI